jgi:2-amino-4-hydroxy-6-hydroxymethyldihydropteridine diphosphokinase
MSRAGIALGSNLGDRLATLSNARREITRLAGVEQPVLASAVYETEPVDCEPSAPLFLNAVMEVGYAKDAHKLLGELRRIEATLGRPVAHARNTSRTVDLDLLYFGDARLADDKLQLPHPRMTERRFVLEPLREIRPELILVSHSETVAELLAKLPATPPLVRVASEW